MEWTEEQERAENEAAAMYHRIEGPDGLSRTPRCAACGAEIWGASEFIGKRHYHPECLAPLRGATTGKAGAT